MASVKPYYSQKTGELTGWKFTAFIGRDASGKQIRKCKMVDRIEGMTFAKEKAKHKAEALLWEETLRKEYEAEKMDKSPSKLLTRREKDKITLAQFIDDRWLPNYIVKGSRKHTVNTIVFAKSTSRPIKEFFGNTKLSEVGKAEVDAFISFLHHDALSSKGKPYGDTTKHHVFATLRAVLNYATYMDYIQSNPCDKILDSSKPSRSRKKIDFLSTEECERFKECSASEVEGKYWSEHSLYSQLFWQCALYLMLDNGLRRGEIVGLQWGDLEDIPNRPGGKWFVVRRNVSVNPKENSKGSSDPKDRIHIGQLKARLEGESRFAPVPPETLELLNRYRTEQEQKFGGKLLPNAFIFARSDDPTIPLYPTELTRMLRKFEERHGLPLLSPHDLRHTTAHLAQKVDASPKTAQAILGHAEIAETLDIYTPFDTDAVIETVYAISSLTSPKNESEAKHG